MTTPVSQPDDLVAPKPAPLWPWMLTCAAAAICIDLGTFHRLECGDSIVPVLSSLYRWTPFYWGANRFGLLVPLLALPWSNPLANLLVQQGLTIFSGLAVLFLLPRHLQRDAHWPMTGTGLAVLLLLFTPEEYRFFFFTCGQSWGPALALILGGMILLEDHSKRRHQWWRLAGALVLILLGHWVNPMPACVLMPLVILRYLWRRQIARGECVAIVSALGGAYVASLAASLAVLQLNLYPVSEPILFGVCSPRLWPAMWCKLATGQYLKLGWFGPAYFMATVTALVVACSAARGRAALRSTCALLPPALLASTAYAALTGSLAWVAMNDGESRYWLPAFLVATAGVASACWAPAWYVLSQVLPEKTRGGRILACALPLCVLSTAVCSYGTPSLTTVRCDIDAACGRLTPDIRAAGCTHIVGDYWKVWPAMFHANLVAYELGEPQIVWGDSYRSTVLDDLWKNIPPRDIKLAMAADDSTADVRFAVFDLADMSRVRQGTIKVFEPGAVFALWMHGFMRHEQCATDRRGRPSGELWICNRTAAPQEVDLRFSLHKVTGRPFPLSITSPWFSERLELESEPVECRHTFVVPPGRHVVQFQCVNPRFQKGGLVLQWAYCVDRPQLTLMSETHSP